MTFFLQEASPPKLSQMADVTAGTYYEEEILKMELHILKVGQILVVCQFFIIIFLNMCFYLFLLQTLGWYVRPETAIYWLTLYFQLASMKKGSDVLEPQFPLDVFLQMTRVGFHWTWWIYQVANLSRSNTEDAQFAVWAVDWSVIWNVSAFYLSSWTSVFFTWTHWTSSIMCWPPLYSHILFNRIQLKKFQVRVFFSPLFSKAANWQHLTQVPYCK